MKITDLLNKLPLTVRHILAIIVIVLIPVLTFLALALAYYLCIWATTSGFALLQKFFAENGADSFVAIIAIAIGLFLAIAYGPIIYRRIVNGEVNRDEDDYDRPW